VQKIVPYSLAAGRARHLVLQQRWLRLVLLISPCAGTWDHALRSAREESQHVCSKRTYRPTTIAITDRQTAAGSWSCSRRRTRPRSGSRRASQPVQSHHIALPDLGPDLQGRSPAAGRFPANGLTCRAKSGVGLNGRAVVWPVWVVWALKRCGSDAATPAAGVGVPPHVCPDRYTQRGCCLEAADLL